MAHKIEVFYTGGGISLAQADLEGDRYAVVSTDAPEYLAIYKREDGEETFLPEDMVASMKPEAGALTAEEYAQLARIAREHIPSLGGRKDLEAMNSDDLDFFETAVWSLEEALAAAYRAGKEAAAKK